MTLTWTPVLVIGGTALAAATIGTVLAAWLFPAKVPLRSALQQIHQPGTSNSWTDQLVEAAATRLRMPMADLAMVARTPAAHLAGLATCALSGLIFPPVCVAILANANVTVPWVLSSALSAGFAVAFAWAFHHDLRRKAAAARTEFTRCLAVYADLVAGELAAGRGHVQALESAAQVCHGWAFDRLNGALNRASAQMRMPWDELRRLAATVDSPDLADLAKIMASARSGTDPTDSLAETAASIRDRLGSKDLADAKSVNARIGAPAACMLLIITAGVLYPFLDRLTW